MDLLRLFRTVRHLKPSQVYGRALHALPRRPPRPSAAPERRIPAGAWAAPVERRLSLLGPKRFWFLNEEGSLERPSDWSQGRDLLWLYNLHYFDDLNAVGASRREPEHRDLVDRWLRDNTSGSRPGWDPYPTSLRLVNWIKWFLGGAEPRPDWLASLALQARWLEARLETHLLGNHLLANAKALVFVGAFFQGPEPDRWLARGRRILDAQLAEQILADGGHFERSPMYHAIILEDVLDLINLGQACGVLGDRRLATWRELAPRMAHWLAAMTHPDGRIAFFNDAAFGIAAEPAALWAYARRLGMVWPAPCDASLIDLRDCGYLRFNRGEAVAILDVGPIGPDYLPGHAHADTLSFELSLGCERIVVNGGTSVYGTGIQRARERATAAHSTVEIDGENSSEVWAGFRVGRRARITELDVFDEPDRARVRAAHDGYRWRPGAPVHRRSWSMGDRALIITDEILGRATAAVARFHLAPTIDVRPGDDGRAGRLITASGRVIAWTSSEPTRVEPSEWRPEFGMRIASRQLVGPLVRGALETRFQW